MASKIAENLFNINNIQAGKKTFKICPKFQKLMIINGNTNEAIRNHACNLNLPIIQLPDKLDRAAAKYLRDRVLTRPKYLRIQANGLRNSLWSRILLIEKNVEQHLRKKVQKNTILSLPELYSDEALDKIAGSEDPAIEELMISNASSIMNMHESDVKSVVEKEMLDACLPIVYSKHLSDLYLVSRLAPNFASTCQVIYEIRKRCPNFNPKNLFDFGSGTGSAAWAANSVWPIGTIKQHYLVDASTNMLTISEYLLKDGAVNQHLTALPGVTHRSFLSATSDILYDLVVSCYSLSDVTGGYMTRRDIITNLWRKTNKFLIIIELGTKAGFQAVLEARDFLITSTANDDEPAHIFAPCPHSMACAKSEDSCSFTVRYEDLRLTEQIATLRREKYSFIILQKGDISQYQTESNLPLQDYPRIVSYKTKAPIQDLCTKDGLVTRYHMHTTDKSLKRFVRRCQPGDLMPVVPINKANDNDNNVDQ